MPVWLAWSAPIITQVRYQIRYNMPMNDKPESDGASTTRNYAHFGCLIGCIVGLGGGIALAWVLVLHAIGIGLALLAWAGATVILGAVGYLTGDRLMHRPSGA